MNPIKKYVLTGGPGIGKTTILELLALQGHIIVPETARLIIEEQQAIDGDIVPWKNNAAFQARVAEHQLETEDKLDCEIAFLDRGVVDGAGYCVYYNTPVPQVIVDHGRNRYEKVFLLDRLRQYQNDASRLEDADQAVIIHQTIADTYAWYGYEVILVPVLPPEDRMNFILNHL